MLGISVPSFSKCIRKSKSHSKNQSSLKTASAFPLKYRNISLLAVIVLFPLNNVANEAISERQNNFAPEFRIEFLIDNFAKVRAGQNQTIVGWLWASLDGAWFKYPSEGEKFDIQLLTRNSQLCRANASFHWLPDSVRLATREHRTDMGGASQVIWERIVALRAEMLVGLYTALQVHLDSLYLEIVHVKIDPGQNGTHNNSLSFRCANLVPEVLHTYNAVGPLVCGDALKMCLKMSIHGDDPFQHCPTPIIEAWDMSKRH